MTVLESKLVVLLQVNHHFLNQAKNGAACCSGEKCIPELQVVKLRTINEQERQACSCNHHDRGEVKLFFLASFRSRKNKSQINKSSVKQSNTTYAYIPVNIPDGIFMLGVYLEGVKNL
jgi:hypothetical protein